MARQYATAVGSFSHSRQYWPDIQGEWTPRGLQGQGKFSAKLVVTFALMATLREIALQAGVSISTASRALSDHERVSEETRARVRNIAHELGYQPNSIARGLRRNQTRTVGLLLPDMRNSSFSSMAATMLQRKLREFGYGLVLYANRHDRESELRFFDRLRTHQVDGVLHVPLAEGSAEHLTHGERRIPVIEFLRSASDKLDGVLHDDEVAAHSVVNHLVRLGHERIGVIAGPHRLGTTRLRVAGARRAVAEAGLPGSALRVVHGEYAPETGRWAFLKLLSEPPAPTAIFATSAQLVLGLAVVAKEKEIAIPERVSVAGFGDPEWGSLVSPPLTTYTLPLPEMAMTAALLMISRIEQERTDDELPVRIVISGNLMVRESTSAPR